jgi:8-hydroxy-5-deazaflavin:NADPH oxidoreductase
MKIGLIGAGNIGAILARKLAAAGHAIRIANSRGPDSLRALAQATGAQAVRAHEATQGVDVVVLSIPFGRLPGLRELVAAVPADVPVADTSNYFPVRDGAIAAVDGGQVESLWVAGQLGRPVTKAWNNVLAVVLDRQGLPAGAPGRLALSVAGDDDAAKKLVMSLVEDTGFDAIDAGLLAESWRQQPITRAYCAELAADDLRAALAAADRERAPQLREAMVREFLRLGAGITTDDIVRLHREASARG